MSDNEQALALLASMLRIRRFEEQCSQLYAAGHIRGSMHLCNGQEAVSVGACSALLPDDGITMTYRGHGQALAKGLDPTAAFAELLGRSTGCCGGYGGSMHFTDLAKGIYGGNALVAAGIPIAVGLALAAQHQHTNRVFLTFFGDGATNQGVWHEAFVLAAMWQVPIVFVCENNLWAEMTPYAETIRIPHLATRAAAYGFPGVVVDGMEVEAVLAATAAAVAVARAGGGPTLIEATTYRFVGHMYGDAQRYKPAEQVAFWQARDPVLLYRQRLLERGIPAADLDALEVTVEHEIRAAAEIALVAPWPDPSQMAHVMEVYA